MRDSYGIDLVTLEREWREEVAKRYTFWPVLFSGTAVWGVILGLAVVTWRKRRRRARTTLDRWEKEEAAEDAPSLAGLSAAHSHRAHASDQSGREHTASHRRSRAARRAEGSARGAVAHPALNRRSLVRRRSRAQRRLLLGVMLLEAAALVDQALEHVAHRPTV